MVRLYGQLVWLASKLSHSGGFVTQTNAVSLRPCKWSVLHNFKSSPGLTNNWVRPENVLLGKSAMVPTLHKISPTKVAHHGRKYY